MKEKKTREEKNLSALRKNIQHMIYSILPLRNQPPQSHVFKPRKEKMPSLGGLHHTPYKRHPKTKSRPRQHSVHIGKKDDHPNMDPNGTILHTHQELAAI